MPYTIPLFYPFIPKDDILKEINDTLSTRWIGQGPKVNLFEQKFNEMFEYKYSVMTNSGTSALELAYHLIGVEKGDDVIVPVLNCTAGQMVLKRKGVNIIFADVDTQLNIDPIDVENKITSRTKAVIGVHLGGIPFNPTLNKICKKYKIPLIVDSAQHHVPVEGDYICYSFQAIKHITTCDGGMLVLNNEKEYKRAKLLRWFGIDRELKEKKNYQAWARREMTFDVYEAGYKSQPTDIDACFGLAALPHLKSVIEYRQKLGLLYKQNLTKEVIPLCGGSYWLMGILANNRDKLAEHLLSKGVENNLIHLRNDIYTVFGGVRHNLPIMNALESKYLYLPLNTKVAENDVAFICDEINKFYK